MKYSGKPWEALGLARSTWYWRMTHGKNLLAPLHEGSGRGHRNKSGRFSGKSYENPPEKIETLRQKYADGVPEGEVEAWIRSL